MSSVQTETTAASVPAQTWHADKSHLHALPQQHTGCSLCQLLTCHCGRDNSDKGYNHGQNKVGSATCPGCLPRCGSTTCARAAVALGLCRVVLWHELAVGCAGLYRLSGATAAVSNDDGGSNSHAVDDVAAAIGGPQPGLTPGSAGSQHADVTSFADLLHQATSAVCAVPAPRDGRASAAWLRALARALPCSLLCKVVLAAAREHDGVAAWLHAGMARDVCRPDARGRGRTARWRTLDSWLPVLLKGRQGPHLALVSAVLARAHGYRYAQQSIPHLCGGHPVQVWGLQRVSGGMCSASSRRWGEVWPCWAVLPRHVTECEYFGGYVVGAEAVHGRDGRPGGASRRSRGAGCGVAGNGAGLAQGSVRAGIRHRSGTVVYDGVICVGAGALVNAAHVSMSTSKALLRWWQHVLHAREAGLGCGVVYGWVSGSVCIGSALLGDYEYE